MVFESTWTDDERQAVVIAAASGKSFSETAKIISAMRGKLVSRSSVAGFANRNKIVFNQKPLKTVFVDLKIDKHKKLRCRDANFSQCCWPEGYESPCVPLCCGRPIYNGGPYCEDHDERAHRETKKYDDFRMSRKRYD